MAKLTTGTSSVVNFTAKVLNFAANILIFMAKILNFMAKVDCLTLVKPSRVPVNYFEINSYRRDRRFFQSAPRARYAFNKKM